MASSKRQRASPLGHAETVAMVRIMDQSDYDMNRGHRDHPNIHKEGILRRVRRVLSRRYNVERTAGQLQKRWSDLKLKEGSRLRSIRQEISDLDESRRQRGRSSPAGETSSPPAGLSSPATASTSQGQAPAQFSPDPEAAFEEQEGEEEEETGGFRSPHLQVDERPEAAHAATDEPASASAPPLSSGRERTRQLADDIVQELDVMSAKLARYSRQIRSLQTSIVSIRRKVRLLAADEALH